MSCEYLAKFIEGASVEQLQSEMKEMYMDEYRFSRTIDKPRLWDILYTLKQLGI